MATLKERIFEAIVKGIQRNGDRCFAISQSTESCFVPVDRGTLKKSGYVTPLENGVEIGYIATHAARIEFGNPAIPYHGTQTIHVKSHTRRREEHMIQVSAHDREYVNKRLVRIRPKISKFERGEPIFRVLKEEPAREGQFYLSRAMKEGLPHLAEDLEFCLKQIERRVA